MYTNRHTHIYTHTRRQVGVSLELTFLTCPALNVSTLYYGPQMSIKEKKKKKKENEKRAPAAGVEGRSSRLGAHLVLERLENRITGREALGSIV